MLQFHVNRLKYSKRKKNTNSVYIIRTCHLFHYSPEKTTNTVDQAYSLSAFLLFHTSDQQEEHTTFKTFKWRGCAYVIFK